VAWLAGAEALAATGLGPLVKDPDADAAVHALAGRAQRAGTPAERAQVFGEVLATCHGCHEQLPR
jgi:cytochrome c553